MDQSLISRISSTPLPLPTNVPHAPKILKVNQLKEKTSLKSDEKLGQVMAASVTAETNSKSEGSDHDPVDKNQADDDALVSEDVSVEGMVEDVEEGVHADFDDNNSEDMEVDMDEGQDWLSCYADDPEDIADKDDDNHDDDDDDDDDSPDNGATEPPRNVDSCSTNRLWGNSKSVANGSDGTYSNDYTSTSDHDANDKSFNSSTPFGTAWPRKSPITGLKGSIIVAPKKIDAIRVGLDYQAEVVPYTIDSSGCQSSDVLDEVRINFSKCVFVLQLPVLAISLSAYHDAVHLASLTLFSALNTVFFKF